MRTVATVAELRAACDEARDSGGTVGLVPTMGYFHDGHRSLMRRARDCCDFVVVTLFVNPTQFAPGEDLDAYPRDPEGDAAIARAEGVDLLFTPAVEEMYPEPGRTTVHVAGLTDRLCGASRPTHFDGVTTVVAKLFSIVGPCQAFFGHKDAQQLAVVTRMAADLNLPVRVIGCPLVRDADGVAMSSRNKRLSADEREAATALSRSLRQVAAQIEAGERDAARVRATVVDAVASESLLELDYAEIVDAGSMEPLTRLSGTVLVAIAVQIGRTRLIDNATFTFGEVADGAGGAAGRGGVIVDLGSEISGAEISGADGHPGDS
jgi:pantoate--beta-alanine ligase